MVTKGNKNINIEVTVECWKKLKIISIDKDMTLQEVVRDILERHINKQRNKIENVVGEE